ncbi:hypothetical protein N7G274_005797 [Stereocaulon virgatum]|uniref:DUF605-domain-containing protein n=1 Tax=Stereocaulon virgatum TaxID=373712 RepID=A0ABR4A8I0_9LECA
MAATIPPALRAADITRFAQRAGQLEKAKPVVAYWCNYWIVEQILAKGLHQKDDDCKNYTMNMMDKLEQTKSDFTENDAIADDVAGQAYIEQFGLDTFHRAENAMKANKASRQTADTFQAAATFLDLCQIWGSLEPEVASKIKFAKYHSLRILKAIKAGEDPNLSNPAPEPEEPPLDPNDPEVQMLNASTNLARQPSVEEVPDEHDRLQRHLAERSTFDESLHPSRAPSVPRQRASNAQRSQDPGEDYYRTAPTDVSPLAPLTNDRSMSDGGGYFPRVPESDSTMLDAPSQDPEPPPAISLPDTSRLPRPSEPPSSNVPPPQPPRSGSLHSFPPPSIEEPDLSSPAPLVSSFPSAPPPAPAPSYPSQPSPTTRPAPQTPFQPPLPTPRAPIRRTAPSGIIPNTLPPTSSQANCVTDEEAILKAQKHARWAISALNFEDVNTAVKELRGALESLGAR